MSKKQSQVVKKQKKKTDKLKLRLQATRVKQIDQDERNKTLIEAGVNQIWRACAARISFIQQDDLNFYERRKLAIEFKEYVYNFVNPVYRDNFYQFIDQTLHKYRMMAYCKRDFDNDLDNEDENCGQKVECPSNCLHIKMSHDIWNSKKSNFGNPLQAAQQLNASFSEKSVIKEPEIVANRISTSESLNYLSSKILDQNNGLGQINLDGTNNRFEGAIQQGRPKKNS